MNGKKGREKDAARGAEPTRREEDISGKIRSEEAIDNPKEHGENQAE